MWGVLLLQLWCGLIAQNISTGCFVVQHAGKQLAMSPGHIHFGNVTVGVPAHRTARLLNCSTDVVRFTVVRPELPLR